MLYAHLQLIIRFLKKNLPCPGCNRGYTSQDIEILELHDEACVLLLACEDCSTEVEVEIAMKDGELHPNINVINDDDAVSEADIENVSKALTNHKGSLRNLLKDENPSS